MTTTRLAMITITFAIGLTAAAAGATTVSTPGHALGVQLARHGADDRGCDDRGRRHCAIGEADRVARHGADDLGCDDRGADNCAIRDRQQTARRGADDRRCDDHGTNLCAIES